ncbi:MAG: 30S ribosomal protein S20 [Candidatus Nealsonbacteria bacterium]|nr:30S ribosomal protein S20 [Candidatus Nealsonbacteria bacterium]
MPILKSAKKAHRQGLRRRVKNIETNKKIKNLLKEVRSLVAQKKTKEAKELLPRVYKALDKAAKVNFIKKGAADRQKSRLTKLIKRAES